MGNSASLCKDEIAMCANARTNRKCINGYSMSTCKCLIEKRKFIRMKYHISFGNYTWGTSGSGKI